MFSVIFLLRCVSNATLSSHKLFDLEQLIEHAVFSTIQRQQNIDKLAGDVRLMLPLMEWEHHGYAKLLISRSQTT